jgi:hypothetical protein
MTPLAADRLRKVVAGLVATALTVLLLRVLARLAGGRQRLWDPELLALVALGAVAVLWVRAATRVRPPPGPPPPA